MRALGSMAQVNPRPSSVLDDSIEVTFLPMKAVQELSGRIDTSDARVVAKVKKGYTSFQENDVLFAKITPCMENGKIAIAKDLLNGVGYGSTEFHVLRCSDELDPGYLFYYLIRDVFRAEAQRNMSGAVGQLRVPKRFLEESPIPFFPLSKQKRIVAKIEELFSEIDNAENALVGLQISQKTYLQSILKKLYCSNQWEIVKSGKLFSYVTSGSRGWAKYYSDSDGHPYFIRVTNVNYETIDLDMRPEKLKYVALPTSVEGRRTLIHPEDILISITGYVGMVGVVPDEIPEAYISQHISLARPIDGVNSKYLAYYLISKAGGLGQLERLQKGATKAGLTLSDIKNIDVPLAPREEQDRIVNNIDQAMDGLKSLNESLKALKATASSLKQSILSKAFKGELV